ncbi:MAG: hypothetical protein CVU15_07330 [Betaproteobacteria bacterium HGW-Betaproteobacteria-1]|jgi:ferric-dicitrate binding protein FerR (iron transport regulator)|nr:MAG: hypothetical protein CVU15_07330 [Betaproteobacteria bacterium HGW-Betaproteobacteria-1]
MNNEKSFRLNSQALVALAISAAFPVTSFAAAGRVEFAIGGVTAINVNGAARPLSKGADINSGDTIKTADGRVQVRFTDGGYMSLQPNTEFVVENYNYDGKQDGSERGFFRLVEGGLRAITGIVGRNNRPAYRVATPVATIGIRGSEFLAEHRGQKLRTRVIGGSIYIENEFGDLILFKGQSAEAEEGKKPQYSEEESGVQAKGPDGGNPETGKNESEQEREDSTIFAVNEQYDDEGRSTGLGDTPVTLAHVIAEYSAQNALGYYILDFDKSSAIAGLNEGKFEYGYLDVYFGDYTVSNSFDISAKNNSTLATDTETFYGSGSLTSAGDLSISGASTGSICGSGCTFNGAGALSGAKAETATINYTINGVSFEHGSPTVTGTGVYNAYGIQAEDGAGAVLYGNEIGL